MVVLILITFLFKFKQEETDVLNRPVLTHDSATKCYSLTGARTTQSLSIEDQTLHGKHAEIL